MNIKPEASTQPFESTTKKAANKTGKEPATKSARPSRAQKKPKKITPTYLHNAGLYYLQRFATSRENFRRVMMRKVKKSCHQHPDQDYEACAAMVDAVVEKFEQTDLLNDEIYTRGVVTSLRRRGKSKRAIIARLKMKGLSQDHIIAALQERDLKTMQETDKDAELHAALIFARKKKIGPYQRADKIDENTHKKALGSLARAGFSYDISHKILNSPKPDDTP